MIENPHRFPKHFWFWVKKLSKEKPNPKPDSIIHEGDIRVNMYDLDYTPEFLNMHEELFNYIGIVMYSIAEKKGFSLRFFVDHPNHEAVIRFVKND